MEKLRTLIVDDEALARRGLCLRLQGITDVEIVGECANGRQALKAIQELDPDLIFLDIQMPGINGFEVVKNLQQDHMPAVVFVTAFDQYAIKAFDVFALDYILKPADEAHLSRALDRARRHRAEKQTLSDKHKLLAAIGALTGKTPAELDDWLDQANNTPYPDKIAIKDGDVITLLPVAEIAWIDAAGDYMCVHAGDAVHIMRTTMKALETRLDPARFQRIHRSTIVNVKCVRSISPHMNGEYHLLLEGGMRLKMSRNYKDCLEKLIP